MKIEETKRKVFEESLEDSELLPKLPFFSQTVNLKQQ